jgi:hypothetical protein
VTPEGDTTYYVELVNSQNCTSASRVSIPITIKSVTSITVQPAAPTVVGIGNSFSLSVTAVGSNLTYQWYKDNTAITSHPSAVTSTLSVPSTTAVDYGTYYVVVTGDCGEAQTSNRVIIDILSPDATLRDLRVNGVSLPDFDPQITDYTYTVLCDVDLADITGVTNHASAVAGNLTNRALSPGDNRYVLSVTAENGFTTKTYTVNIIRDCYVPRILKDLEEAIICLGESHTFEIEAEGHNLTYEWYFGNNRILGANSNTYTVTHAELKDYGRYYVIVRSNFNGYKSSVYSQSVRLSVLDRLPERLLFSSYPDPATTGQSYRIQLAGYPDVTKYRWSYRKVDSEVGDRGEDSEGVTFSPPEGGVGENETWATFGTLSEGFGLITAILEHPCGRREVSQSIRVQYPTGREDVTGPPLQISPNPTSGIIKVSNTELNRMVRITDLAGSLKGVYPTQEGITSIDLTAYAKGTYILQYNGHVFKLIKK